MKDYEFRWQGKKMSDLSREELLQVVDFFVSGHDAYLRYAKLEDMKKLEMELKIKDGIIEKMLRR